VDTAAAVGIGIGVFGVLVSVTIAYFARRPKRLDYSITTNRQILVPGSYRQYSHLGALAVTFEGERLSDPRLLVFRIANSGKIEIRPDDFDQPLHLSVGLDAKVVTAGVVGSQPADLSVKLDKISRSIVALDPVLLNSGDWVDIQLLIDGLALEPTVNGRIAGATIRHRTREAPRLGRGPTDLIPWPRGASSGWSIIAVVTVVALVLTTLFTVIFPDQPRQAVVPDLVGKPVSEAPTTLRQAHLHLGGLTLISGSKRPKGTVLDQYPGAGRKVTEDSSVSAVVSNGPSP